MQITLETLQARLAELHVQKERAFGLMSAVDGAIQEIEFWIKALSASEVQPENEKA